MKIIIPVFLPNIQSQVDPRRFGRSPYLLEVDPDTLEWKAYPNADTSAWSGASVRVAQFVADRKANAVISGDFDESAYAVLDCAGVAMSLFKSHDTVYDAITHSKSGNLQQIGMPERGEHSHALGQA